MYIIDEKSKIVNEVPDDYRDKINTVYGPNYSEYTGEVEEVGGVLYAEGFAPVKPFEDLKAEKTLEIKNAMIDAKYNSGYITSSLGFEIDARVDDLTNVTNCIDIMVREGLSTKLFRDHNNGYHNLTLEEWNVLKAELQSQGEWLYQHKWEKEQEINAITDDTPENREDLEAIKW